MLKLFTAGGCLLYTSLPFPIFLSKIGVFFEFFEVSSSFLLSSLFASLSLSLLLRCGWSGVGRGYWSEVGEVGVSFCGAPMSLVVVSGVSLSTTGWDTGGAG